MPSHLGILCHLESLPRYAEGILHFSLNVTPVLVGGEMDEAWQEWWTELLKPWSGAWRARDMDASRNLPWRGVLVKPGGDAAPLRGTMVSVTEKVEAQPLIDSLQARFVRLEGDRDRFAWDPKPVTIESPLGERPTWHALLANAMRYPAPLPRAVSLCCVFTLPEAALEGVTTLFAAPVLEEYEPDKGKRPQPLGVGTIHRWEYLRTAEGVGDASISAYSPPFAWKPKKEQEEKEDTEPDFFDVARYWVKRPPAKCGHQDTYSGDWTLEMEVRLAHGFDLAQRLVDAAREKELPVTKPFRDAVLAALRDTAGTGTIPMDPRPQPGPPRGTVAADILSQLLGGETDKEPLPTSFLQALDRFEAEFWKEKDEVEQWRGLLRELVPEVAGLSVLTASEQDLAALGQVLTPEGERNPARERLLDELDHLQSVLAREDVAGALLLGQWERAVRVAPTAADFWNRFSERLRRDVIPAVQLRERLLRASFFEAWSRLLRLDPEEPDERKALRTRVGALLRLHYRARFGLIASGGEVTEEEAALREAYAFRRPRASGSVLPAAILEYLAPYGECYADLRVLPAPADQARPTEVPQGVTVQVARLVGTGQQEEAAADAEDELRQVAGIGLLMREAVDPEMAGKEGAMRAGQWRCLNMADVRYGAERSRGKGKLAVENAVVPWRLHYQGELRQALVTYDNHPLIADSPAAGLAGSTGAHLRGPDVELAEIFCYEPPDLNDESDAPFANWAYLPPLKFGSEYQILPFLIGTSGALPAAIADPNDPTRIRKYDTFETLVPGEEPPGSYIRTVAYARTVRVGQVRFAGPAGAKDPLAQAMEKLPLPRYPEGVVPLANDLAGPLGDAGRVEAPLFARAPVARDRTEVRDAKEATHLDDSAPLLLLWDPSRSRPAPDVPGPHRFQFALRKPATDLLTWDRWVAAVPGGSAARRTRVWAELHRENARRAAAPAGEKRHADATLEDPAVDGFFMHLLPVYAPAGSEQMSHRVEAADLPSDASGVGGEPAPRLSVTCALTPGASPRFEKGAGGVIVHAPEGQVWELRVYATVPEMEARKMSPAVQDTAERFTALAPPEGVLCFAPLRLQIEGATPDMPTEAALWRALQVRVDEAQSRISVRLDPRVLDASRSEETPFPPLAPLLKNVELRRQMWRWHGRHAAEGVEPPFATSAALDPRVVPGEAGAREEPVPSKAMQWEVGAFSDRAESDHLLTTSVVSFTDPPQYPRYEQLGTSGAYPPLFQEPFDGDPRARYYRFGVRVYSRYRGLFPTLESGTEGVFHPALRTQWRRGLVRARPGDQPIPSPLVRIVVPLTASARRESTDGRAAGRLSFLVVLNEAWYERYGFAEKFEVAVDVARDPLLPTDEEAPLEIGPDPILTGKVLTERTIPPGLQGGEDSGAAAGLPVQGPIGYTFDTDTDAPLFVRSSFLVEADSGPEVDLTWFFIKLRFRRKLLDKSFVGEPERAASAWTPAYWAQFVPDSRSYCKDEGGATLVPVDFSALEIARSGSQVEIREKTETGTDAVRLVPTDGPFRLWAVLTRLITDVVGYEQEAFVALMPLDGKTCEIPDSALAQIDDRTRLRLRLLEVQRVRRKHPGVSQPPEPEDFPGLARELFGDSDPDADANARIVRVSPAIDTAEG